MRLEIERANCGYGGKPVVEDVSLSLDSGAVLCLLGANGSGKTTLFKAILGLLRLNGGRILVDGADTAAWPQRRLARTLAYVPQAHTPPFPFAVRDVVLMARTAHLGLFGSPSRLDAAIAEDAMEKLGVSHLAHARYTEISGGERQLVLIARALAQQSEFLIMDEPTSNLDFGNQVRVLRRVKELAGRKLGLLMTTHFPDHAFLCASRVAVLKGGKLLAMGRPEDVLTQERLESAYGVSLRIVKVDAGLRVCVPEMI
ncbi:MAG: ABC transporter ATP-binding protein [Bryobacteraceae bacterium]